MSEDRLNVLAVLSIEEKFIQSVPDFDNKVIDVFSSMKHRGMVFFWEEARYAASQEFIAINILMAGVNQSPYIFVSITKILLS